MGESVAALFLAGIVPGIMVGVGLMLMVKLMADKYDFPVASARYSWPERGQASLKAFFPLMTPVIILGGILGGIFTPTEAAAVAVGYAAFIGLFVLKSLHIRELPAVLMKAAMTSSVVLLLVGAAMAFKTVVSLSHAPETLAEYILSLSDNPLILLFLINILLFLVGMFLDAGPAIIILGPILGPIFVSMGVDPIHFAIIMSVNLTVGLATPPMGLVLFVASSVSGERVENIARAIVPFLLVEILVIFLITYIPAISMTIPRITGFVN
jgi:tripartite ATP-independent transporter DctM subunit